MTASPESKASNQAGAAKIHHDTFIIERTYRATPEQVFRAWSNPEAKAKWFGGPSDNWTAIERSMDFRVGGKEIASGRFKSGMVSRFDATYFDIVENQRVVYTYDMYVDDRKLSVSLASIELRPTKDGGTRMVVTEQGAYFGDDTAESAASRKRGTEALMDNLGKSIGEPEAKGN